MTGFPFRRGLACLVVPWLCASIGACDGSSSVVGPALQSAAATVTLVNFDASGKPLNRFDTRGSQVDAHGGEIRWFEGRYYLYGETYGCGFEWHKLAPSQFCGFRVYSSPNLVEWTDHGLLFDVTGWEPWQRRCHGWSNGCFRPHVVFNRSTGKYVLWVNVYDDPGNYYVLESSSPTGPFVERALPRLAFNSDGRQGSVNNGDENLFVDDDGTAYIIYTEWAIGRGDLVVERLTPDYLSGTGQHVRLGVRQNESPTLFKRNGRYYVTSSSPPNAAYGTSVTSYYSASTPLGSWSKPRQLNFTSCGGQPGHVSELPSPDGKSWYLYQSDLWLNSDGREAGDLNQAPAPQFWAPLAFDPAGEIRPITCERSYGVPALLAEPPAREADARRLQCDVGEAGGRGLMREFRFVAQRTGRARSVAVNTYQRGEPGSPLVVDLRAVDAGGAILQSVVVEPDGASWELPVNIAWSARREELPVDVAVEAGREYAVRLHSATTRGCYGYAFRSGAARPAANSWVSTDGGTSWTQEAGQAVEVGVEVEPAAGGS